MNKLSGYCEVTIAGQLYRIKFGMGAWSIIARERDKTLKEMFAGLSELEFFAWLVYGGINYAALAGYGGEPLPNLMHAFDLIDEMTNKDQKLIGETFANSQINGKTIKEYLSKAGEPDKKKAEKPLMTS